MNLILRNDDVCSATSAAHLQKFCELTDKYGYRVLHAITPRGVCWAKDRWLGQYKNQEIVGMGAGITIEKNPELIEFLQSRTDKDLIGIHGLWHTHRPPAEDWLRARDILSNLGLYPLYLVPPFNEGKFKSHDFFVSGADAQSFETDSHCAITTPIAQMHSWRYDPNLWKDKAYRDWWTWEDLERNLQYPVMTHTANNLRKYEFLSPRIKGKWIDIGCNAGRLLDMVPGGVGVDASAVAIEGRSDAKQARAESLPFPNDTFETAVLCGVLEQCEDWSAALKEAIRVTQPGGKVIGVNPIPGSEFGKAGASQWTASVIPETVFLHTERINTEHYFFQLTK